MELAVYYDEKYPATWLERYTAGLKLYLEQRGFKPLNAKELKSWMHQKINEKTAYQTSLVFSQDAVPDTVLPDGVDCANVLFRRYLDDGGRIVWLGDIPLWYRAHEKKATSESKSNFLFESWQFGVPWAVLGAVPLIADSSTRCEWVQNLKGRMKSRWHSMRPINIEKPSNFLMGSLSKIDFTKKTLSQQGFARVRITPLAYADVTLVPSSYNMLAITRWKKAGKKVSQISGQVGVGAFSLGAGLSLAETFPKELGIDKTLTLACAWHVRFNEMYPTQGFYRFLDAEIDEIDSKVVEDVETLAKLDIPV